MSSSLNPAKARQQNGMYRYRFRYCRGSFQFDCLRDEKEYSKPGHRTAHYRGLIPVYRTDLFQFRSSSN